MFTELALTSVLALNALAVPHQHSHHHRHSARQDAPSYGSNSASNFTITVNNNCSDTLTVATYAMNSAFIITQESATHTIEPDCSANVTTSYSGVGMRLSPNAHLPVASQYLPHGIFEYGYSSANGLTGTAYDISLMEHIGPGMKVEPAHPECESKCCTPSNCPVDQGWTDPAQGYAADVTCYQGKVDFTVTFCPSE